jgi:hypothetical protein
MGLRSGPGSGKTYSRSRIPGQKGIGSRIRIRNTAFIDNFKRNNTNIRVKMKMRAKLYTVLKYEIFRLFLYEKALTIAATRLGETDVIIWHHRVASNS